MKARAPVEPPVEKPIVFYASMGFDSYTYSLDIDCRDILATTIGAEATRDLPRRVTIALDLKKPFEVSFGAVYRHVFPLLTTLSLDELCRLGSVVVLDAKTDATLWNHPKVA
jgi:hypothetical protein